MPGENKIVRQGPPVTASTYPLIKLDVVLMSCVVWTIKITPINIHINSIVGSDSTLPSVDPLLASIVHIAAIRSSE
jgi:hypothetical protein